MDSKFVHVMSNCKVDLIEESEGGGSDWSSLFYSNVPDRPKLDVVLRDNQFLWFQFASQV
jgi:hypothetical protein